MRRHTLLVAAIAAILIPLAPLGAQAQDFAAFFSNGVDFVDEANRVCLGDGMGGFTCSDVSMDTNTTLDVALGDVNGDAYLDAVFANGLDISQANRVCLGDGMGGFTCSDISMDANETAGVALGDVNGDANLDAVFATGFFSAEENRVCLGDGTGGFTCSAVSADTNFTLNVALGDVNGDANLDAVFANAGGATNRVCLGDGMGGFTCSDVSMDTNISLGVALGYVDGDANLDAVFANGGLTTEANQVCLGDGTGGFTCSDVSLDNNDSAGVALGYVDGDANLDAVFANGLFVTETNRVCLGDGMGSFTCSDVSTDTNETFEVALGDVNGDASVDAVFANFGQVNRVCLGDGTGGFTCSDVNSDTNFTTGVALGKLIVAAPSVVEVPTLTVWGLLALSVFLALVACRKIRLPQ